MRNLVTKLLTMGFTNRLFLFSLIVCLTGCGDQQFENGGGNITLCIDNSPATFVSSDVNDVYSTAIMTHVYEGLVSFNPEDLSIQNQLAKKWSVDPTYTVYTFELREDVYFHEHDLFKSTNERKMSAEDVIFSIEKSCKPNQSGDESNAFLSLYKDQLKGANDFFNGKSKKIAGLSSKGNKVELVLIQADPTYINKLAQITAVIVSKKIASAGKETDLVGTGPFQFSETKKQNDLDKIYLVKNQDYYLKDDKGNSLPYLDSVTFVIQPKKLEQLEMFEKGELDMIKSLPSSRITEMLEGEKMTRFNAVPPTMVLYNNPLLTTHFYFFNMTDPRFQDPKVRMAFNYAIDRNQLADNILRNQFYEIGRFGVVPPIESNFKGFDFGAVSKHGYNYDPEKAKKMLAEAGFPNGQGFGSVNLRIDIKDLNSSVAEEIASQINQTLGINVNIDGSTWIQKNEDATYARGDVFRTSWVADYNSPETFLSNFYGKFVPSSLKKPSELNQSRYQNKSFDTYFEKGRIAKNQNERYSNFVKAEIELLKDPPFIPLWYANDFQIVYSNVRNLKLNPMNLLNLTYVYKKEWTKDEYLKTQNK
jgi:oligopeptide transport system substrate-binding protein